CCKGVNYSKLKDTAAVDRWDVDKQRLPVRRKKSIQFNEIQDNGVPKVDPRLPLDAKQVFKLKQSWKGIKRKIEETGVEMFVRLFKTENIRYIFTSFKDLETEDDLRANEALEQHATFVMTTLDETISNIENYDYVTEKIRKPFLEAVQLTLGDRYTDYMSNVYGITIDFILKGVVDGYKEGQTKNDEQAS
ncbi:hypothetical protein KUTeg_013000, partial [Tegillarca granosa]